MQRFNYHTHTYRCGHAEKGITDEEIVKEFIKNGFTTIAFTDHCPQKNEIDNRKGMRMKYSEKEGYLKSIKYLKEKYANKIKIESGFEIEYLPGEEENLRELKNEVDKTVLGQHFIYDDNNETLKIFRHHEFTDKDLVKYAEYISKALDENLADIVVHPDLYMLARDTFGETESKVANIICKAAEKHNISLEINLSDANLYLIKPNRKVRYPCKEFWEIASKYNIKVLYGVDAHYKTQIRNYKKTIKLVNEIIGEEIISKLNFCDEL